MFFCDNLMQILLYGIIFLIEYQDKTKKPKLSQSDGGHLQPVWLSVIFADVYR